MTGTEKLHELANSAREKLDILLPKVQQDTLIGMNDADTLITSRHGTIRETPASGLRYDAVELPHNGEYDMYGTNTKVAGENTKSAKSMLAQRVQTSQIMNKALEDVTEQDMIDVANYQQIQKLADLVRSPGEERWIAPLVKDVVPTDLSGKHGALNIPINVRVTGQTGGRSIGQVINPQTGEDITRKSAIDPNLNASYAGLLYSTPAYTDYDALSRQSSARLADVYAKQGQSASAEAGQLIPAAASAFVRGGLDLVDAAQELVTYVPQVVYNKATGSNEDFDLFNDETKENLNKTIEKLVGYKAEADQESAQKAAESIAKSGFNLFDTDTWGVVKDKESREHLTDAAVEYLTNPSLTVHGLVQILGAGGALKGGTKLATKVLDKVNDGLGTKIDDALKSKVTRTNDEIAKVRADNTLSLADKKAKIAELADSVKKTDVLAHYVKGTSFVNADFAVRANAHITEYKENNNGEEPDLGKLASILAIDKLLATAEVYTAKNIIGADGLLKPAVKKTLTEKAKDVFGGLVGSVGAEAVQEGLDAVGEVINTKYDSEKYKDTTLHELLKANSDEILGGILAGAAGGAHMRAPAIAKDIASGGMTLAGKGVDKTTQSIKDYVASREQEKVNAELAKYDTDAANLANEASKTEATSSVQAKEDLINSARNIVKDNGDDFNIRLGSGLESLPPEERNKEKTKRLAEIYELFMDANSQQDIENLTKTLLDFRDKFSDVDINKAQEDAKNVVEAKETLLSAKEVAQDKATGTGGFVTYYNIIRDHGLESNAGSTAYTKLESFLDGQTNKLKGMFALQNQAVKEINARIQAALGVDKLDVTSPEYKEALTNIASERDATKTKGTYNTDSGFKSTISVQHSDIAKMMLGQKNSKGWVPYVDKLVKELGAMQTLAGKVGIEIDPKVDLRASTLKTKVTKTSKQTQQTDVSKPEMDEATPIKSAESLLSNEEVDIEALEWAEKEKYDLPRFKQEEAGKDLAKAAVLNAVKSIQQAKNEPLANSFEEALKYAEDKPALKKRIDKELGIEAVEDELVLTSDSTQKTKTSPSKKQKTQNKSIVGKQAVFDFEEGIESSIEEKGDILLVDKQYIEDNEIKEFMLPYISSTTKTSKSGVVDTDIRVDSAGNIEYKSYRDEDIHKGKDIFTKQYDAGYNIANDVINDIQNSYAAANKGKKLARSAIENAINNIGVNDTPGGKKILEAIKSALKIEGSAIKSEWDATQNQSTLEYEMYANEAQAEEASTIEEMSEINMDIESETEIDVLDDIRAMIEEAMPMSNVTAQEVAWKTALNEIRDLQDEIEELEILLETEAENEELIPELEYRLETANNALQQAIDTFNNTYKSNDNVVNRAKTKYGKNAPAEVRLDEIVINNKNISVINMLSMEQLAENIDGVAELAEQVATGLEEILADITVENQYNNNGYYLLKDSPARKLVTANDELEFKNNIEEKMKLKEGVEAKDIPVKVDRNVALAIHAGVMTYLANNRTELSTPKEYEEVLDMLGLTHEDMKQVPDSSELDDIMSKLETAELLKFAADDIATDVMKHLGITENSKIPAKRVARFKADLGTMIMAYMSKQGLMTMEAVTNPVKIINNSKLANGAQMDTASDSSDNMWIVSLNKDLNWDKIKTNARMVEELLQIDLKINKGHRTTPTKWKHVQVHRQPYTKAPAEKAKGINIRSNREYGVNRGVKAMKEFFGTKEELLKALGHKSAAELKQMEEKQLSWNVQNQARSNNRALEVAVDAIWDLEDESIYFDWLLTKGGRSMIDSVLLNPQTEKELHRWLVLPKESVRTVDVRVENGKLKGSDENVLAIAATIGQAFGISIDSAVPEHLQEIAEYILGQAKTDSEFIRDIINGTVHTLEIEGRYKYNVELGHIGQLMAVLPMLNDLNDETREGELLVDVVVEADGKTNGLSYRLAQLPIIDEARRDSLNEKVGIMPSGTDSLTRLMAKGIDDKIDDMYETIGRELGNLDNKKLLKEVEENSPQLAELYKELESKKLLADTSLKDGSVTSFVRNLVKPAVMVFNYAAGEKSIRREIASELSNELVDKLLADPIAYKETLEMLANKVGVEVKWLRKNLSEYPLDHSRNNSVKVLLFGMYDTMYAKPVYDALVAQFKQYLGITELTNTVFKMMSDVFSKALGNTTNLSKEEYIKTIINNLNIAPIIKSSASREVKDGVLIAGKGVVNGTAAQTRFKPGVVGDQVSVSTYGLVRTMTDGGNSGSVIPTHTEEGNAMNELAMNNSITDIYDAFTANPLDMVRLAKEYNEIWWERNKVHSIWGAIVEAMDRVEDSLKDKSILMSVQSKVKRRDLNGDVQYTDKGRVIYDTVGWYELKQKLIQTKDIVDKGRDKLYNEDHSIGQMVWLPGSTYEAKGNAKENYSIIKESIKDIVKGLEDSEMVSKFLKLVEKCED